MVANDSYVPCVVQVQTNAAGQWFLEWDTQYVPNGIYDVHLELIDLRENTFYSATNSITVSNLVSFNTDLAPFGDRMWLFARVAVPCAKWEVKMYDKRNEHIGSFFGTTTNGLINFIWDLKDANGRLLTNEDFRGEFCVTPSPDSRSMPTAPPGRPKLQGGPPPPPDETPRKLVAPRR
jgi:hypothetical protein